MYRAIAGDKVLADAVQRMNLLGRRLLLLHSLSQDLLPHDLTPAQASLFQELLLDAVALQEAAGGRHGGLFGQEAFRDPSRLGPAAMRRAKVRESDEAQRDWYFQLMVQAWAGTQTAHVVKDLKADIRFRDIEACDFAIERPTGRTELLECKRVHPQASTLDDRIQATTSKLITIIPGAVNQLRSTAEVIGRHAADLHLLLDIGAYSGASRTVPDDHDIFEIGGFDDEEIDRVIKGIAPLCDGLAQVTVCWHMPITINGIPHAIVQRTRRLIIDPGDRSLNGYPGWTVELIPMGPSGRRELRIAASARPLDSILTEYRNLSSPGTFATGTDCPLEP